MCIYVRMGWLGLPWPEGEGSSRPLCLPPPSQVTVGGPSWLALGRLDPYGTGGGKKAWLMFESIGIICAFS